MSSPVLFPWHPAELAEQPSQSAAVDSSDLFCDILWGPDTCSVESYGDPFWVELDISSNQLPEEMNPQKCTDTIGLSQTSAEQEDPGNEYCDTRHETHREERFTTGNDVSSSVLVGGEGALRSNTDHGGALQPDPVIPDEGVRATLSPGVDEDDAAPCARGVLDSVPCQSLLLLEQLTETPPDGPDTRLEDVSDDAEDATGQYTEPRQGRDAPPTYRIEAQPGSFMPARVAASVQTSQSEHRLNEESLSQQQKVGGREAEVVAEGAGRERAATSAAITLDDGRSDKQPVCGVQEERAARNDEAEEGAGSPYGPSKEAMEDRERSIEPLRARPSGFEDNPILLDDDDDGNNGNDGNDEEPECLPSPRPIESVSDCDGSHNITKFSGYSSSRRTRQKRKTFEGIEPWGDAEFSRQRVAELHEYWGQVHAHWLVVDAALPKLREQDPRLLPSLTQFYASFYRL